MVQKNELSVEDKAFEKALKFLEIRLHTEAELRRKLRLRGVGRDIVDKVIARLFEYGYINDLQFAEVYLDNLIRFKVFGYYMLMKKLLERGVDRGMVEKLLQENFSLEKEKKLAEKFLATKKQLEKNKAVAGLKNRGFRTEVIRNVIDLSS